MSSPQPEKRSPEKGSLEQRSLTAPPGMNDRTIWYGGRSVPVPKGWDLLPPGDATWTRRVKAGGPCWTVQEKKGRKTFSRGVWAPADRIASVKAALDKEREDPAYKRRLAAGRQRRADEQVAYTGEFRDAILQFLAFAPNHRELAQRVATAIADHAVPVGSGTVARTKRIPVERRAEAATIAWLRHQTTEYDDMSIPRVKGMRREVRRLLAQRSRELLKGYREGAHVEPEACPLAGALRT